VRVGVSMEGVSKRIEILVWKSIHTVSPVDTPRDDEKTAKSVSFLFLLFQLSFGF
jgi:hypothetical protein